MIQRKKARAKNLIYKFATKRKGILPGLLTTGSLFVSFYSIISAINDDYVTASLMIILAAFLDAFDGRVARFINSCSNFGEHYDSLADVIAFGATPAILIYIYADAHGGGQWGNLGISIAFVYMACCCVRLARFASNGDEGATDFKGMPSPTAGGFVAAAIWVLEIHQADPTFTLYFSWLICLVSGLLMVSNLSFISGRRFIIFTNRKISVNTIIGILYFAVLATNPAEVLFLSGCIYILSALASSVKKT
ncbi:MAG: phosphatidylcholine/phosphatidylserine synthase [Candidatus Portiera sp.]|nr:phosphatidylcholine/phosphatidylserine synthase [Portiera sp.]